MIDLKLIGGDSSFLVSKIDKSIHTIFEYVKILLGITGY